MIKNKKEYFKNYYLMHKEEFKNRSKKRYLETKEETAKYQKNYYEKHKEEKKLYYQRYYKLRKIYSSKSFMKKLQERKIVVTEDELKVMKRAACNFIKSMNSSRSIDKMELEDELSDAYCGLLVAIRCYDPTKNPKKNAFLSSKIKWFLIDCYRDEFGRKDKKKINFLNCHSFDIEIDESQKDISFKDLIASKETPQENIETILDCDHFVKMVKKEFAKIYINGKLTGNDFFNMWLMRTRDEALYKEISKKFKISESRVSQIFSEIIKPEFEVISKKIQKSNPSFF